MFFSLQHAVLDPHVPHILRIEYEENWYDSEMLLIRFNFLRHVMRAILSVRPKCSHRCVSLKEIPSNKTCVNPQAHSEKLNRANRYENEMV